MPSISKTIHIHDEHPDSIESAIEHSIDRATESLAGVKTFSVEAMGGRVDESGKPSFTVKLSFDFEVRDTVGHGT